MISLDTNILARYLLKDDEKQSKLARTFLQEQAKNNNLYVSPFVLMELAWVLKAKGLGRQQIVPILEMLLETEGVLFGQKNILIAAVHLYRKYNIGFSDCLIISDSEISANARTATFDIQLLKTDNRCFSISEAIEV